MGCCEVGNEGLQGNPVGLGRKGRLLIVESLRLE